MGIVAAEELHDDSDDAACYRFTTAQRIGLDALRDCSPAVYYRRLLGGGTVLIPVGDTDEAGAEQMTVIRRFAAQYVRERVQKRELAISSARRVRGVLASFARTFGERDVAKMGTKDVERWIASRGHLSANTRRNEVVIVRGFVKWLRSERKIKGDPMLGIRNPKTPRSVPRALTDEEMRRLWKVLPDARAHVIIALMVGVGLRRGEVISLQTGDWDRDAGTLRVCGKGGHTRLIPVPTRVAALLNTYLRGLTAGPLVRRVDGMLPISNGHIGRIVMEWMVAADVKHIAFDGKGCHSFRHTFASRVADKEPDLRVLQSILGHVSLTSTQIYLRHAEMGKLRAAMEHRFMRDGDEDGAA